MMMERHGSGGVAEAVEVKMIFTQGLAAEFDEVLVMGEEKDLCALGQRAELRKDGSRAIVVEGDQQVIQNERHGLMLFQIAIKRGQPEGQVELIPGTGAQTFHRNLGIAWPDAHEDGEVGGIKICIQPAERAAGDGLEHFA